MSQGTRSGRGRGRPSSPVLSRERVTLAAIRIVTEQGYRHLTMAALAKELGVAASALYNHVASKRDVLILLQERVNERIDDSAFGTEPWDQALRQWARSYRRCFMEHTALIPVMAVLPVADSPGTLRMYERVTRALEDAGIVGADAVDIIVGVEALVFGAAYDASAPEGIFDPGGMGEVAPTFTRFAAQRSADPRAAADRAFELALDALVSGLRQRYTD
ncbi:MULTISPECIES: TetR/AcrR family transcriptional regulator [unclassified Nocardiopsis]|uniref:TetR/AcrR family transcriptional regulator n=1 Tax=unclassified Nocardiopsis TaxID=2649073 RepID=UPI00066E61A0|nr:MULTISPECIES: TetR/AcrR family transcriptional regulator C-terminal domain-containing protein [unclassified Nocardiopsis]MBQ1084470.1 TetR/AcrR family transcriptional regulator C-terminal domain-containing protein [Nocardiopsis sp. B62]